MTSGASLVTEHLDSVIERRGDAPAYHFKEQLITFSELGEGIVRAAVGLASLGVKPGDRVAVMLRNRPEFFFISQAIWRVGAIMVPINVLFSEHEIRHVVDDAGVRCLVVNGDLAERARSACADVEGLTSVVVDDDAREHADMTWAELLAGGAETFAPRAPREDRLAVVAYTSGTTGMPKGAMITDMHLHEWMLNASDHLDLGEKDNFLQVFPVHSVPPNVIGGWLTAFLGSSCSIIPRMDVAEIAKVIEEHKVTCFAMVTAMLFDLLRYEFPEPPDFSSVRYIQAGGESIPDRIRGELRERWGIPMIKSYGSTEASYVSLDYPGVEAVPGASGQVMPNMVVTVRGTDGEVLPKGETGEICVGPNPDYVRPFRPILGYWNDPEKTAAALTDGEFHTGDLGYVDDDDFISIVDRLKDMLIRGGNNIYPAELETALRADDRVDDAYVVGIHDDRLGDLPKAYIVLTAGAGECTPEELITTANVRLARYKRIETAEFIATEDLPRNAMNKVLKRELAKRANQPVPSAG
jgi:acyl-CoA synthetase (AMP-forming)/AMP-acid ligase II